MRAARRAATAAGGWAAGTRGWQSWARRRPRLRTEATGQGGHRSCALWARALKKVLRELRGRRAEARKGLKAVKGGAGGSRPWGGGGQCRANGGRLWLAVIPLACGAAAADSARAARRQSRPVARVRRWLAAQWGRGRRQGAGLGRGSWSRGGGCGALRCVSRAHSNAHSRMSSPAL
jgi:hypothetical protein